MDEEPVYTENPGMVAVPQGIDPKAIGRRIIVVRQAMGMSAADFARHVEISTAALSNYETGYRRPDWDQALKFVQKTGVTLDYLYLGDPSGLPYRLTSKMPAEATPRKTA